MKCQYCNDTGHVSIKSMKHSIYTAAVACTCPKGNEFQRIFNTDRWNGKRYQSYNRETWEFLDADHFNMPMQETNEYGR